MLTLTINFILVSLILSILVMLKKKTLREKYSIVWLGMVLIIFIGFAFPSQINEISRLLGFQYLSNFVLLFFGIINLTVMMHLSVVLGKTEDQTQTLAEELALLKSRFEDLQNFQRKSER